MTQQQLQALREVLAKARIQEERNAANWPLPRRWNAGVDFVENRINRILKDAHS